MQNEKKKILDPSYNSFKSLEERQTISFYKKKDKDEILSLSNKMNLGLCIEDKKIDMIESIIDKKNENVIKNTLKLKKKKYSFKKYTIEEIKSLNEERIQKCIILNNNNALYTFDKIETRLFKLIEIQYGIEKFYSTVANYLCLWYNNNGWNKEEINPLFFKFDENKAEKLRENLPYQSREFEIKFLKLFGMKIYSLKRKFLF